MLGDSIARMVRARDAAYAAGIWLGMAVIWLGMAMVSEGTLQSVRLDALVLVSALGILVVLSRRPWSIAAPLGAAAFIDITIFPWAVAAAALTWDTSSGFAAPRLDSEAQRQLMRSRRREEAASVVVVHADPPAGPEQLRAALRATDGFDVVSGHDGLELRAVLEEQGLDRKGFEQRMLEALGAPEARFGWASFPADGVTLEILVEEARSRLESAEGSAARSPVIHPVTVPAALPATATAFGEES